MKLYDLFDINLYADMIFQGMVGRQFHPNLPLVIINYTHQCQFSQTWNQVTKQCRGLIYNLETEEVVARPFPKFFNAEELGPSKVGQALGRNVQATDKLDGSLGILYPDSSRATGYAMATRGSFTSEQAVHATDVMDDYMLKSDFYPSPHYTYLFEIIYPQNRIVLDYGSMDDLVLLATVDKDTGTVDGPDSVPTYVWPGPRAAIFPATSIKEVRALPIRDNAEGFVLRNTKTGFMAKMKYEEYVRIHRIVFGMNEKRVHQHLREGRDVKELYFGVPEEFHEWITSTIDRLGDQYCIIRNTVVNDLEDIEDQMMDAKLFGRKAFAELAKTKKYPGLLFQRLDNRDITDACWKLVSYDGRNKMAAEQSEDTA
jgi:RNA ligase